MQLYQFYLPDELPEFDCYRVTSISADVECLLRRTAALVPPHYKPGDTFSICTLFFKKDNHVRKYILFVTVSRFTVVATWLVLAKHSNNGVLLALNIKPYFLSLIFVANIAFMQIFHTEEVLVPFIVAPEMLYKGLHYLWSIGTIKMPFKATPHISGAFSPVRNNVSAL